MRPRYTQFCEFYRQWFKRLRPSMRQIHRAGEKTFIDFSGKRPSLVDRRTGELRPVELFVSVLGASSLTYAEATETQQLPDWVNAHIRMAEGIVPFVVELRVTDSLSPLRSHLYYATSATTPSGGAIASRAPTRCCRSR